MIKREKVILIGPSGSGKDFLKNKLSEKGLKSCLKWTTRPIRKGEKDGIDYKFVNETKFKEFIDSGSFITHESFNVIPVNSEPTTWYYGITKEEFENSQLFIMTPSEFLSINWGNRRKDLFVVFLDIDRSVRESRLFDRKDNNDSIKRRLDADDIDFKDFKDWDLKITDPEFSADDIFEFVD